jgi:hypothetical protein
LERLFRLTGSLASKCAEAGLSFLLADKIFLLRNSRSVDAWFSAYSTMFPRAQNAIYENFILLAKLITIFLPAQIRIKLLKTTKKVSP